MKFLTIIAVRIFQFLNILQHRMKGETEVLSGCSLNSHLEAVTNHLPTNRILQEATV